MSVKYFQAKLFSRVVGVGLLMNCLMNRENYGVDFFTSFLVRDQSVNYKTNSHWKESHLHFACIKIWLMYFSLSGWKIKEHNLSFFFVILKKTWHRVSFWLTFFFSIGLHNHIMLNYTITYSRVIYLYSSNIWMTIVLWTLASNCARWRSLLKKTNHRHCHSVQYHLHLLINLLVICSKITCKMTSKMTSVRWLDGTVEDLSWLGRIWLIGQLEPSGLKTWWNDCWNWVD